MSANAALIDRHLKAYNAQSLDEMMEYYAPDCVQTAADRSITERNREEIRARYIKAFATFPKNRAELKNRIVVGDTVVDHEYVERAPGAESFEIIAIYTIKNGLIARVDFAK